jgi:hypothetical protein
MGPVIEYIDDVDDKPEPAFVEFVAGPRAGERDELAERPAELEAPGGTYVRSFRCADDGAVRYMWRPASEA